MSIMNFYQGTKKKLWPQNLQEKTIYIYIYICTQFILQYKPINRKNEISLIL